MVLPILAGPPVDKSHTKRYFMASIKIFGVGMAFIMLLVVLKLLQGLPYPKIIEIPLLVLGLAFIAGSIYYAVAAIRGP